MRTPSLEKAAAFAAASKKTGGIFVFATRDAGLLQLENASAEIAKNSFAEYSCKDCGTHHQGVAVAGLQPYCVACGSDKVKQHESAQVKVPRDSEMSSLSCPGCGVQNVVHAHVAGKCESIHCTVCGTEMKTIATADTDMDGMMPDVDDMDLVDVDAAPGDELAETTMDAPSDKVSPDLTDDEVDPVTTTQDMPSDKPSGEVPADPVAPSTTLQDPVDMKQVTADEGEDLEVDMSEEIDLDGAELSFVYLGDSLSLFGKGQIVATLTAETAGDNAELMQTETFRKSVAHTLKTLGLKKAIAQYGFKPNKLKVNLSKTVAKKIEARVAEKTKELSSVQASVMDDVGQSIDIAAAGFAGNFWRDRTDPLKLALAAELKALNIRNPNQFVDKVFAAHSVSSQRVVIELARELIKKPVEARNALANAIDMAKYQPMVVKAADEDGDDDSANEEDDVEESDVAAIATPVEAVVASTSFGGFGRFRSPELQSLLGDGNPLFN